VIPISIKDKNYQLTEFQWKVLSVVLKIPFGQTRSYQWVAQQTGNPKAVRAVGTALRKNPFPLIIPCHRVIRSDGTFGQYCGRNDKRKEKLLYLEQEVLKTIKAQKRGIIEQDS